MNKTSLATLRATDVARIPFPLLNATNLSREKADNMSDSGVCLSLYSEPPTDHELMLLKSYHEYLQRERILPKKVLFQKLSDASWYSDTKQLNVRAPKSDTTLLNLLDQIEGSLNMVSRQEWEHWKKRHQELFWKGGVR